MWNEQDENGHARKQIIEVGFFFLYGPVRQGRPHLICVHSNKCGNGIAYGHQVTMLWLAENCSKLLK